MARYELSREQAKLILEALTQREIYFNHKEGRAVTTSLIQYYRNEAKRCADLGEYFLSALDYEDGPHSHD